MHVKWAHAQFQQVMKSRHGVLAPAGGGRYIITEHCLQTHLQVASWQEHRSIITITISIAQSLHMGSVAHDHVKCQSIEVPNCP